MATPTKPCRGPCNRLLPVTAFAFKGRGDERRSHCRRCAALEEQGRRAEDRQRCVKRCDECGHKLPFDRFARIPNTPKFADTCLGCAKYLNPAMSPIEEAEAVQAHGLRLAQRWAVAWDLVATERGVTMAEYRALRGLERQEFEDAWTEEMKRLSALLTTARGDVCRQGHPWTPESTVMRDGKRRCAICLREANRRAGAAFRERQRRKAA